MAGRGRRDQVGRTFAGPVLSQWIQGAAAFLIVFAAIIYEQYLYGETMNQSSDVNTVSAFEIEEAGLSAVLSDAIRDQREVVEYLAGEHDHRQKMYLDANSKGQGKAVAYIGLGVMQAEEMKNRAMNVLGLLEAAREREAGQVA